MSGTNNAELYNFFRALPVEVLWTYRARYLKKGSKLEMAEELAEALVPLFADYEWVHKQLKRYKGAHHQVLLALIEAGGVVGGSWLLQELSLAHGHSEDYWADKLADLGRGLIVFGNSRQNPPLFYVLPKPIAKELSRHYTRKLKLPVCEARVRRSRDANYNHPVGMSLISFVSYVRQHSLRTTQSGEIFKKQAIEVEAFFSNLWGKRNTEKVLNWQIELLTEMGILKNKDGHLSVDEKNFSEWMALSAQGRRDLYIAVFRRTDPLIEHLLGSLSRLPGDKWAPLDPLRRLYRRWYMGQIFFKRHVQKSYYLPPSGYHDAEPPLEFLSLAGLVELGLEEGGRAVRLTRTGRAFATGDLLGEAPDATASFFLQPNFDVLASASLPLEVLARLGEIATLTACDRMSTYALSRDTVREALRLGWRAEDMLEFLTEHSAHGLPSNVEGTLAEWIGSHGEVEFHDALILTVRAERLKALLKLFKREVIPLRELGIGVVAIAREDLDRARQLLADEGFALGPSVRRYDAENDPARRRGALHRILRDDKGRDGLPQGEIADVNPRSLVQLASDLPRTGRSVAAAQDLSRKPGSAGDGDFLRLSPGKIVDLVRAAIHREYAVELLYNALSNDDPEGLVRVSPLEVQSYGAAPTFTARLSDSEDTHKFAVRRIRGIRVLR